MKADWVMEQLDRWNREAAARLRAWKAAGRTDEALAAIYTPDVCADWDCETPAEMLACDRELLADAWLWEHRNDGGAT